MTPSYEMHTWCTFAQARPNLIRVVDLRRPRRLNQAAPAHSNIPFSGMARGCRRRRSAGFVFHRRPEISFIW